TLRFWVGGHNLNTTAYRWLNGNEVTEGWVDEQPDSNESGQCLLISYEGENKTSGLSVCSCNSVHGFICQLSKTPTSTTSTITGPPTADTSHGWCHSYPMLKFLIYIRL
ncbi:unnamed protein product, partial [Meganyctiphanes norvegica]